MYIGTHKYIYIYIYIYLFLFVWAFHVWIFHMCFKMVERFVSSVHKRFFSTFQSISLSLQGHSKIITMGPYDRWRSACFLFLWLLTLSLVPPWMAVSPSAGCHIRMNPQVRSTCKITQAAQLSCFCTCQLWLAAQKQSVKSNIVHLYTINAARWEAIAKPA